MKNQDNSFGVLAAIIVAGVILSCVPTANSRVVLNPDVAAPITAVVAPLKSEALAIKVPQKSGTCSNEHRAERKAGAKLMAAAQSPTV